MTTFNPQGKEKLTHREALEPAADITEQADADQYLNAYIQHLEKRLQEEGKDPAEAESIAKQNIGYYAGYYGKETYERMLRLFRCSHPFFGNTYPTSEQAFNMGLTAAKNGMAALKEN